MVCCKYSVNTTLSRAQLHVQAQRLRNAGPPAVFIISSTSPFRHSVSNSTRVAVARELAGELGRGGRPTIRPSRPACHGSSTSHLRSWASPSRAARRSWPETESHRPPSSRARHPRAVPRPSGVSPHELVASAPTPQSGASDTRTIALRQFKRGRGPPHRLTSAHGRPQAIRTVGAKSTRLPAVDAWALSKMPAVASPVNRVDQRTP
jgi:hypothetical protein